MAKYKVLVVKSVFSAAIVDVEAESKDDAKEKALKNKANHTYDHEMVMYDPTECEPIPELGQTPDSDTLKERGVELIRGLGNDTVISQELFDRLKESDSYEDKAILGGILYMSKCSTLDEVLELYDQTTIDNFLDEVEEWYGKQKPKAEKLEVD